MEWHSEHLCRFSEGRGVDEVVAFHSSMGDPPSVLEARVTIAFFFGGTMMEGGGG